MKQYSRLYSRWWVIFLLILLLVGLSIGYWYLQVNKNDPVNQTQEENSKPTPDTATSNDETPVEEEIRSGEEYEEYIEEINIAAVDLEILRNAHPKMKSYYKLEEQIQGYQKELASQKDGYQLALEQVQSQNSDLNNQLDEQLKNVREKYQQEIDEKTKELQAQLTAYEEKVWNEVILEIQRKKDDLQSLAQEMIVRYREKQETELKNFQEELSEKHLSDILNLRLKLQMVQLTEEEQKNYKEQLTRLQLEQQKQLEEKSVAFDKELTEYIEEQQVKLENELKSYQKTRQEEANKALQTKQAELDEVLRDFIARKEQAMYNEFVERQTKLEEQAKTSLLRAQQEIQQEIQKKEKMLKANLDKARDEQHKIIREINENIYSLISNIAEEEGIDLVLTGVRVSVDAVDITQQVLRELK